MFRWCPDGPRYIRRKNKTFHRNHHRPWLRLNWKYHCVGHNTNDPEEYQKQVLPHNWSSDEISDITIERNCLNSVIFSIDAAKRSTDIAVQNVIIGFVVKAILIALTLTGFCNLWFALFIDLATALGTILNSIRAGQFKTHKVFVDEDYDDFDD